MRTAANNLSLDLIIRELTNMAKTGTTLSDKEREFLIKAYVATKQDIQLTAEVNLDHMSDTELEELLKNGTYAKPSQ